MRLERFFAPSLLLAGLLTFFLPLLTSGRLLAPGDGIAQNFPMRVLAAEAIRRGEMPFWNPFNFSGTPLLASLQPGVFFPPNWAFWVLPPVAAMHVALLAGYALAGLSAYAFARALSLGRFPALVSGFTYMLSGYLLLNAQHIVIVHVAALVPLLLWAIERFRTTGRAVYAAAGAVVLALQIFAGHPQMLVYGALVALAYAAFRGISLPRDRWPSYGLQIFLLFVLGGGLSLVQLLPAVDFIRETQRHAISFAKLVFNTPTLLGIPGLLFPGFLGSRTPSALMPGLLWPPDTWRWWLQGYVGVGGVLLALVALLRWRQPQVIFWGAVAGLALLLAMGDATPLYRLWALVPVVNQMPYPHRHLLEFTLAIAVLAGLGAEALTEGRWADSRRRLLGPIGLLALALGAFLVGVALFGPGFAARTQPLLPANVDLASALQLTQPAFWLPIGLLAGFSLLAWKLAVRPGRALMGGWLLLMGADLGLAGYHNGYWALAPRPPDMRPRPEDGRSLSVTRDYYPFYRPIAELEALAQPSLSGVWGVHNLHGYDAFIYRRYGTLLGMSSAGQLAGESVWEPAHHGFALLGLRRLRVDEALTAEPLWQARLNAAPWRREGAREGVVTYLYAGGLPKAWRVATVRRLPPEAVDARISRDPGFRPEREALVESAVSEVTWSPGTATARAAGMNRIQLTTAGPGPGFIVVSESYDPGWRAFAGERELPVHRTDALVLGIEVPPGAHEIRLEYVPRTWRAAVAGSAISVILLLGWLLLLGTRRETAPPAGRT